jgi:hypothetical protein
MTNYNITLGSLTKGARISQAFNIRIPTRFTFDELKANYRKNVAMFDIDPEVIGDAGGNQPSVSESNMEVLSHYKILSEAWSNGFANYISEGDFIAILMFLFGHGLEDFTYEVNFKETNETPLLNLVGEGGVTSELGVDFY